VKHYFRQRKKVMIKIMRTVICAALLILCLENIGPAQDRVTVEQEIRFRRGSISAVITGKIRRGTSHQYHVRARKGQQMAVVLKTGNKTSFTVSVRNAGILESADGMRRTLVELPETGDYLIEIGTDATANYTLEVTIK
jgi:hypothetical protein